MSSSKKFEKFLRVHILKNIYERLLLYQFQVLIVGCHGGKGGEFRKKPLFVCPLCRIKILCKWYGIEASWRLLFIP